MTHTLNAARGLAARSNAFAIDLWRCLRSVSGNLAVSPASISMAMAMTYGGARGETAVQIQRALHFDAEPSALMTSWGAVARDLMDAGARRSLKLAVANRLFGETTYAFEDGYIEATRVAFDAPLERLPFRTAPEPSRSRINTWIEERTAGRIQGLLPIGAIEPRTRLVLVNAIDFVAGWESPFSVSKTVPTPFHSPIAPKLVQMMRQTTHKRFVATKDAKILELPYANQEAVLLIALPHAPSGLDDLEAALSLTLLQSWMDRVSTELVDIRLPRFEVTTPAPILLSRALSNLGMPLAFDAARADFTGMECLREPSEELAISEVFHKAVVKTDEEGTVASAATAVSMVPRGRAPVAVEFKADHPFLFFVVEKASRLVLFMGRVVVP